MDEETKFHWDMGMKYALEAIKTQFVLNGAATVSILTFIGNTGPGSDPLVYAMGCFALGAATSPFSFVFAYFAQLNYGNAMQGAATSEIEWTMAVKWHYCVYIAFALGMAFFIIGVILAGFSFMDLQPSLTTLLRN